MRPGVRAGWILAAAVILASCSPGGVRPRDAASDRQDEASYLAPPRLERAVVAGQDFALEGAAASGAQVRLVSPRGESRVTRASARGDWRLTAPITPDGAIFGLSQQVGGRTLQAEGYVFLSPTYGAWILRAGAAARPVAETPQAGLVVDSDRAGGTMVSGRAQPGGLVGVQLDGRRVGEGRADASGRFEIRLKGPAPAGDSRLRVFGDGVSEERLLAMSPPQAPGNGPLAVTPRGGSVRIDWLTPGGGVQSTQILP